MNTHTCVVFFGLLGVFIPIISGQNYTDAERTALKKFRTVVENALYREYMQADNYLIRWLRARNLDIPAANEMLRRAHAWRKENKIDDILDENVLRFRLPPYYVDGFSFYGWPVLSFNLGRLDLRKLVTSGKRNLAVRYIDQLCELCEQGLVEARRVFTRYEITQGILILDLSGYSLRQHSCIGCIPVHIQWIQHIENYYPGLIKYWFFINTPRIYRPIIELVKTYANSPTLKAIRIYGSDRDVWAPALLKLIPATQLRKQFGGTKPEEVLCKPSNYTCHNYVFFRKYPNLQNLISNFTFFGVLYFSFYEY